jgi:8-hydroxy-5-deazaflavin:NADPH oxidoreductase
MRIGVIGSGRIGTAVAQQFVRAGHEVAIANSRGPESLGNLVAELGSAARAASVEEAAEFGELVVVAIPLGRIDELPPRPFAGKIVIDANNYYSSRDGEIPELESDETTSSELLARQLPDATVIKAFNTMYAQMLADGGRPDTPVNERLALFAAGDDAEAKRRVMELIEEMGFAALDTGSLADGGRRQQPGSPIYTTQELTGAEARAKLEA